MFTYRYSLTESFKNGKEKIRTIKPEENNDEAL
jgi:hypothetical protein